MKLFLLYVYISLRTNVVLDVPIFHMAKYVLIKLVRDDKAAKPAAPISITHFGTIGCTHERFKLYHELMTTVILVINCFVCLFGDRKKWTILFITLKKRFVDFSMRINNMVSYLEKSKIQKSY